MQFLALSHQGYFLHISGLVHIQPRHFLNSHILPSNRSKSKSKVFIPSCVFSLNSIIIGFGAAPRHLVTSCSHLSQHGTYTAQKKLILHDFPAGASTIQ